MKINKEFTIYGGDIASAILIIVLIYAELVDKLSSDDLFHGILLLLIFLNESINKREIKELKSRIDKK